MVDLEQGPKRLWPANTVLPLLPSAPVSGYESCGFHDGLLVREKLASVQARTNALTVALDSDRLPFAYAHPFSRCGILRAGNSMRSCLHFRLTFCRFLGRLGLRDGMHACSLTVVANTERWLLPIEAVKKPPDHKNFFQPTLDHVFVGFSFVLNLGSGRLARVLTGAERQATEASSHHGR